MHDRRPEYAVPPPEARFATRGSAAVARRLERAGLEVRFSLAADGRHVSAVLCDADGVEIRRLTASEVLTVAAGEPPPSGDAGGARPLDGVLGAAGPGLAVPGEDRARARRGEGVE
jgi:hypothetical protein